MTDDITTLNNTVLIAGIGRSGTTWLGDILNYDDHYRVIFEPLHPEKGVPLRQEMVNGRYIRPDEDDARLRRIIAEMLSGKVHNAWTDQYTNNFDSSAILVKSLRLNLALGWLRRSFPTLPIIYITRHPGAVVSSQLRMNWATDQLQVMFDRLLSQADLIADHLSPFVGAMQRASGEFERRVFFWCIVNTMLMSQFQRGDIQVVCYEDLVLHPAETIDRLFSYLKRPYDTDAVMEFMRKPSATTWSPTPEEAVKQLDKWQGKLEAAGIDRLTTILALFGLDQLYGRESAPLRDWFDVQPSTNTIGLALWKRHRIITSRLRR